MNKNERKQADNTLSTVDGIRAELDTIKSDLESLASEARESNGDADPDDTPLSAKQQELARAAIAKAVAHASVLESAHDTMQELSDAEQEKYDNASELTQSTERAQSWETNAGNLSEVADSIEEASSTLNDVDVSEDTALDASKLEEIAESIGEVVSTLEGISFDAE